MRTFTGAVGLATLAGLVAAQEECLSLTTLFPECAFTCIVSAGSEVGCTDTADVACRCTPASSSAIVETALNCVLAGCPDFADVNSAIAAGSSVCACVATATTDEPETTSEPPTPITTTSIPTVTSNTFITSHTDVTVTTTTTEAVPTSTCDAQLPCQSDVDAVPECAVPCIESAAVTDVGCGGTDYECQCASSSAVQAAAQGCVIDGCGPATALEVLESVSALCDCVEASPSEPCEPSETTTPPEETTTSGGQGDTTTSLGEPEPTTTCTPGAAADCGPLASTVIPECAQPCFTSAAPDVGCDVEDFACQCEDEAQASLSEILVPCVATACPPQSLPAVIDGASSVCSCAQETLAGDCTTQPPPSQTETTGPEPTDVPSSTVSVCAPVAVDCGIIATSVIPSCAQPCFTSAAPDVGCDVEDFACQCEEEAQESLSAILVPCVASACPPESLDAVIEGASSVCDCATQAAPTDGCETTGPGEPVPEPEPTDTGGEPQPTDDDGGGDDNEGGDDDGGDNDGGDNDGGDEPPAIPGVAPRVEFGLVAGVFGAFWMIAVAL